MKNFIVCCIFFAAVLIQTITTFQLQKKVDELHECDIILANKYIEADKKLDAKIEALSEDCFKYSDYVDNMFSCMTNQFVPCFIERKVGNRTEVKINELRRQL